MEYGINIYYDKELMSTGRTSMEKLESKAVDAIYSKISEQLKESIANSVKEQIKYSESQEVHVVYNLEEFIKGSSQKK